MVQYSDYKQFRDIEGYFLYIRESMSNGQRSQVKALFLKLSKKQRNDFFTYLLDNKTEVNGLDLSTLKYCISFIY